MNDQPAGAPPNEEEMRRQLAEELKKIDVRDVVLQSLVTLINLGGQRLGLSEETSDVRDLEQARIAIEAVRGLLPLMEAQAPEQISPLRDALAQLQVAYAREVKDSGEPPAPATEEKNKPSEPPAPESKTPPKGSPSGGRPGSGGIWVPPGSQT